MADKRVHWAGLGLAYSGHHFLPGPFPSLLVRNRLGHQTSEKSVAKCKSVLKPRVFHHIAEVRALLLLRTDPNVPPIPVHRPILCLQKCVAKHRLHSHSVAQLVTPGRNGV